MKYQNSTPYHKILELLESKKFKYNRKITIYNLYNFNPLILNKYLELHLKEKSLKPKILSSEFDQIDQGLLSISKNFKSKKFDILIVGSDINAKLSYNESVIDEYLNSQKNNLTQCLKIINKYKNLPIIFFNCNILSSSFFSSREEFIKLREKIFNFNQYLYKLSLKNKNFKILDINVIGNVIGLGSFYDSKNYYISKTPYSQQSNNHISFELSQTISSIFVTRKKCLVLDLDNTLWGGVLGEDGPNGIDLGESYKGECFRNFQKYIKKLLNKGIILAICSKNNIQDVRECFKKNKEMILNFNDFSNVQINWKEKYLNINKISEELNIGKDSMVFFDDSSFEREQMKKFNTSINVIETPKEPENFIQTIENSSFFYQTTLTTEDKKKKYQYKILKKANKFKDKTKNISEFLKGLSMTLEIDNINKFNFERAVQLTNKVNQFNLTTKRYSSSELQQFLKSKNQISLLARLKDKFGDHGLTALAMAKKKNSKTWIIDNFLLSCRILGRGIENALLYELLKKLKKKRVNIVKGIYIKTKKNHQCKDFYIKNFFIKKDKTHICDLNKIKKMNNSFLKIKYE